MEESDTDFTPTPNTSSNLASLFGSANQPLQGNPSLTYTAPKAPKSPLKNPVRQNPKMKICFSRPVQVYKLESGNYVKQGVTGMVISSFEESHIYEIILYKPNKEYISQTRITRAFSVTLSPNNYVSFYDNKKQNWLLLFRSPADVEQFALKLAILKFYSSPDTSDVLVEDLTPVSGPQADETSTVQISYCGYSINHEDKFKINKDIKGSIKISQCKFVPLQKGLLDCSENGKRVIIVPRSLSAHWSEDIQPNKDLLLEVSVEKFVSDSETALGGAGFGPRLAEDGRESQKANLISRMARMGQISLPIKQNLSTGPSDSEEESSSTTSPKPRAVRNRASGGSQSHPVQRPELVSAYQNDVAYHSGINRTGVAYQQLIPVSASPLPTPSVDSNLAVESRIQAAELRMGMSRISEKLDLVWNKIQNMDGKEPEKSGKSALLDSGGILASIQSLITENESLRTKVEEQKGKIEQQNDKIFQLFELNHKLLEQNTTSHDKQSLNESKLRAEVESLRLKEAEVKAESKEALEKMKVLEGNLTKAEEANRALSKKVEELTEELRKGSGGEEERTKELESLKEKLSKAWDAKTKLRDKLREAVAEKERLSSAAEVQKEVKDCKVQTEEYQEKVEEVKKQTSLEELKAESKLEEENKRLKEEMEETASQNDAKLKEVSLTLRKKFPGCVEYSSSEILATVEKVFSDATHGTLKPENEASKESRVVPAPRTSLSNANAEERSVPEAKKETENGKKDAEKRRVSYDQSWRTMKPPPVPLFDDDDEDDVEDDVWFN